MSQFQFDIRSGVAWVTFDSGGLNTLSAATVRELKALIAELNATHQGSRAVAATTSGESF